jgi:hypothetical protein
MAFSTWATPQKAEVFGGRQSPHPAAAGFLHSLRKGWLCIWRVGSVTEVRAIKMLWLEMEEGDATEG